MRTEIKRLHQDLHASMVYVTHDQIEAMTLATKIVVMKDGVIQQIGTPAEIYRTPANLFVADFMGSPAMNLIPAKVHQDGNARRIEIARDGEAPLVLTDRRGLDLPKDVIIGLRPEDITDPASRQGDAIEIADCIVDVVEPAGADTYVVSRLGGKEVTARLQAETDARPGARASFAFDLAKASYFEPKSGIRLS
jgi:multiple sugar transport system ATP-binding protein